MDSPTGSVRVETQEQSDGQEEKGRQVLQVGSKPGVLTDSRRLPREDWVLDAEKIKR